MLSHILGGNLTRNPALQLHHIKGLSTESVDLLTAILRELFNRIGHGKKKTGGGVEQETGRGMGKGRGRKPCVLEELYNDSCVAVLARSVQCSLSWRSSI